MHSFCGSVAIDERLETHNSKDDLSQSALL